MNNDCQVSKKNTAIKICGLTRCSDIETAVCAGAGAIGFVFYAPSPRFISTDCARELCNNIPPFVSRVGLFVNAEPELVKKVLSSVPLSLLQFHGDESPDYCEQFERPYIKAVRFAIDTKDLSNRHASQQEASDRFKQIVDSHSNASGFLLDAFHEGAYGGTGKTFDWGLIPEGIQRPIILAGGLNEQNVAEAIQKVQPYAVDVSSGVEAGEPGIKDPEKIKNFIQSVLRTHH